MTSSAKAIASSGATTASAIRREVECLMRCRSPAPVIAGPEVLRRDVGRVDVGHEPAAQDHLDGVRQADQLVQVGGDQQHRQALGGGPRGCGPRSRPGRRRRHRGSGARRSAPSARRSSPGRRSASAGCRRTATAASTSMPGVRTSYSSTIRWVSLRAPDRSIHGPLTLGALGLVAEDPVLPERRRRAAGRAGAGPRGCSRCRASRRRRVGQRGDVLAAEGDACPAASGRMPMIASTSSAWPLPSTPAMPSDLAAGGS